MNVYDSPGPVQHPVNVITMGLVTTGFSVGTEGVSVKASVGVSVGGKGVGVTAPAVWSASEPLIEQRLSRLYRLLVLQPAVRMKLKTMRRTKQTMQT
jgi:hypothetical protein